MLKLRQTSKWIYSVDYKWEKISKNIKLEQNEIWKFLEHLNQFTEDKEKLKEWLRSYWIKIDDDENWIDFLNKELSFDEIIVETKDVILRMKNK